MRQALKSIAVGAASGVLTFVISVLATGYLPVPSQVPYALWELVVLLGVGATLVAFLIHFYSLRRLGARAYLALIGFALTIASIVVLSGLVAFLYKTLCAWLIGAILATVAQLWLWPNNSFKPNPLRGSA
jgi:hypothetical protein